MFEFFAPYRQMFLPILVGLMGCVVFAVLIFSGVLGKIFPSTNSPQLDEGMHSPQFTSSSLMVHVSGAIKNPGVYTLPLFSRVKDVIAKAGGVTQEADQKFIIERLNLVERVKDGEKIYIPARGEGIHLPFSYEQAVFETPKPTKKPSSSKIQKKAAL